MNAPAKVFKLPSALAPEVDESETEAILEAIGHQGAALFEKMCELNDKNMLAWAAHTDANDLFGGVSEHVAKAHGAQLCTRAWCKFYEILAAYDLVPCSSSGTFRTFHLCEAPGAFVTALNHYLFVREARCAWTWQASTLNPHYEGNSMKVMVGDDRLIMCTLDNWTFGRSNTGDILERSFLELLQARHAGSCDLVTADGSFDCARQPENQELAVFPIIFAEVVAAITLLKTGGHLVVKKFTNFKNPTIGLIFTLTRLFKDVQLFKPRTSKPGNSECYLVCRHFQGAPESCLDELSHYYGARHLDKSVWPIERIPTAFFRNLLEGTQLFTGAQIGAITSNVDSFESGRCTASKQAKSKVAKEWAAKLKLKLKLPKARWLGGGEPVRVPWAGNNFPPRLVASYDERHANLRSYLLNLFLQRMHDAEPQRKRLDAYRYGLPITLRELPGNFLVDLLGWVPAPEATLECGVRSSKFAPLPLLDLYYAVLEDETLRREIEGGKLLLESLEMVDVLKSSARSPIPCPLAKEVATRGYLKEDWILLMQAMLHSRLDVITLCIPHPTLLLTRFSVSLVYLLAIMFEAVEVQNFDTATRIVCARRRSFTAESVDCLDEFLRTLMESVTACRKRTDRDVLQPLPLSCFLEEDFYSAVVDQNYVVLLRIFDSLKQYVV